MAHGAPRKPLLCAARARPEEGRQHSLPPAIPRGHGGCEREERQDTLRSLGFSALRLSPPALASVPRRYILLHVQVTKLVEHLSVRRQGPLLEDVDRVLERRAETSREGQGSIPGEDGAGDPTVGGSPGPLPGQRPVPATRPGRLGSPLWIQVGGRTRGREDMSCDPPAWMGWKQPGPQDPRATPRTNQARLVGRPTGAGLCLGASEGRPPHFSYLVILGRAADQFQRWGLRPKMRPPKADGRSGEDVASLPEQRGDGCYGR